MQSEEAWEKELYDALERFGKVCLAGKFVPLSEAKIVVEGVRQERDSAYQRGVQDSDDMINAVGEYKRGYQEGRRAGMVDMLKQSLLTRWIDSDYVIEAKKLLAQLTSEQGEEK
jgi:hypothetical protein